MKRRDAAGVGVAAAPIHDKQFIVVKAQVPARLGLQGEKGIATNPEKSFSENLAVLSVYREIGDEESP
jgi:hypothetical protein